MLRTCDPSTCSYTCSYQYFWCIQLLLNITKNPCASFRTIWFDLEQPWKVRLMGTHILCPLCSSSGIRRCHFHLLNIVMVIQIMALHAATLILVIWWAYLITGSSLMSPSIAHSGLRVKFDVCYYNNRIPLVHWCQSTSRENNVLCNSGWVRGHQQSGDRGTRDASAAAVKPFMIIAERHRWSQSKQLKHMTLVSGHVRWDVYWWLDTIMHSRLFT